MRSTRRAISHKLGAVVGIGGIHCYCCTSGKPSKSKRLWNRITRRIANAAVRRYREEA